MSTPFTKLRPSCHGFGLAAYLVTAALPLGCTSTAAIAADLPVKSEKAAAYQWSGCYFGLNGGIDGPGVTFATAVNPVGTHLPTPADALEVSHDGSGAANTTSWVAGGQVGCNWQSATLVLGLEGDFDYLGGVPQFTNDTNLLPSTGDPFVIKQSLQTDYLGTVRARVGVAADRNLGYLTGGVAFTQTHYTQSYVDSLFGGALPGAGVATASKSLIGWVAGAGWEHASTDNWIFRVEYLFTKFGATDASGAITDAARGVNAFQGAANDLVVQILRVGVNYKFSMP